MARNPEDIEKAFSVFVQQRTIEGTARVTHLPVSTLRKWKIRFNWEKKLEDYLAAMAGDPLNVEDVEEYGVLWDISEEDLKQLGDIKQIEGICMCCLTKDKEEAEKLCKGLTPKNFPEAMSAMEKCWKARGELLHRGKTTETPFDGKTNFIDKMIVVNNRQKKGNE